MLNQKYVDAVGRFERSDSCDCPECRLVCSTGGSYLGPGDVDRISDWIGMTRDQVLKNLIAVTGVQLEIAAMGDTVNAPLLRFKQREDTGLCAMYSREFRKGCGGCVIHTVAPFWCSRLLPCRNETEDEEGLKDRMVTMLMANLNDYQYVKDFRQVRQDRKPVQVDVRYVYES